MEYTLNARPAVGGTSVNNGCRRGSMSWRSWWGSFADRLDQLQVGHAKRAAGARKGGRV